MLGSLQHQKAVPIALFKILLFHTECITQFSCNIKYFSRDLSFLSFDEDLLILKMVGPHTVTIIGT